MARFTRFRGRLLFGFMLLAPLVVPEVILGLSLLAALCRATQRLAGWPRGPRRHDDHDRACDVWRVVCRGAGARPACRIDRSLEEAALDLGARPWACWRV